MADLKLLAWVLRGRQRRKVLLVLNTAKTPTLAAAAADISLNNASDILRLFVKRGVAVCVNPKEKAGRLYELTNKGILLRKELLKLQGTK